MNIGQAGVQLGGICWELYCKEHGLDLSGNRIQNDNKPNPNNLAESPDHPNNAKSVERELSTSSVFRGEAQESQTREGFHSFFVEMSKGNYSPRSILVDLEPSVVGKNTINQLPIIKHCRDDNIVSAMLYD